MPLYGTFSESAYVFTIIKVDLDIWNGGSDLDNGEDAGSQGAQVPDADEESVGAYLLVNWDDDDGDGTMSADGSWSSEPKPDLDESTAITDEDNLAQLKPNLEPMLDEGTVELEVSGADKDKIKLWEKKTKETEVTLTSNKKTWDLSNSTQKSEFEDFIANSLWIEGIDEGSAERAVTFTLRYKDSGGTEICDDVNKATVVMINLADAVYRDNMLWSQNARGHSAIVWAFDGPMTSANLSDDTKFKIVEMQGPTKNRTLATITQDASYPARGCYTSSGLTYIQRLKILKTALSLVPGGMGYPTLGGNVLEPKNTWDGALNTVTHLRCDGLIEMCYEIIGVDVWGMERTPDSSTVHYDISDQSDNWNYNPVLGTWSNSSNNERDNQEEHNDFDFTLWFVGDWDDTLMPATQAGYVTPDNGDTKFSSQDLCKPVGSTGGN